MLPRRLVTTRQPTWQWHVREGSLPSTAQGTGWREGVVERATVADATEVAGALSARFDAG